MVLEGEGRQGSPDFRMRLVFVNRFFYPDSSATSQMLTDLCFALAARGHSVHVITSRLLYENPNARLPIEETVSGVRVTRIWTSRLGRVNALGRALDYLTFHLSALRQMLRLIDSRTILVVKTDPPMLSVTGALAAWRAGAQLVNWTQDLFPEVASAVNVPGVASVFSHALGALRNWSLSVARLNVFIGEKLLGRLRAHEVRVRNPVVIHNWADGGSIVPLPHDENTFRADWGLQDKFVVGYSGNLGRVHEYAAVLDAIGRLKGHPGIVFLFIGGGQGMTELRSEVGRRGLNNVQFRPYQARESLSFSLGACDAHLVTLKPEVEGLVVPSKFYGILAAGRPTIFVGSEKGEIADLILEGNCGVVIKSGDGEALADWISKLADGQATAQEWGRNGRRLFERRFSADVAFGQWEDRLAPLAEQMGRPRILFLTDNFPPETNAPASRTYEHTKRWVAAGYRVCVVTTAPNFPEGVVHDGYRNRIWHTEEMDGIDVIRLWTYITANEGVLRRTADYLSFMLAAVVAAPFLPRADVIVATSPQFFVPCAAAVLSRAKRVPWIFELRDLWPDSIVAVGVMGETMLIRALRRMEYFLYRDARRIVSVTHSFREVLTANGIDANKIAVIPNGADLEAYAPGARSDELAVRLGLTGKFVAAYVGTMGLAHHLVTLLDAAERLKDRGDIGVIFVGSGAEEKALRSEAARRKLPNVIFAGAVSKREVRDYWRLCDVALVLLRDQALFRHVLPSKIFEAMATERALILGARGESASVVEEAQAGIPIPPEDAEALARAIARLADNPAERTAMGKAGRRYVTERFNRDALAGQMLKVIEDVASARV